MGDKGCIVGLCVALALLGTAAAADKTSAATADPAKRSERSDGPTAREAKLKRARDRVAWMSFRASRVQAWLLEARSGERADRSRCLDDMLSQAHAVERMGYAELAAIERLIRNQRQNRLDSRLIRVAYYAARSARILNKAQQCGKKRSKRARTPTYYRVTVIPPR